MPKLQLWWLAFLAIILLNLDPDTYSPTQHPHPTLLAHLRLGHLLVTTTSSLLLHPKHVVAQRI